MDRRGDFKDYHNIQYSIREGFVDRNKWIKNTILKKANHLLIRLDTDAICCFIIETIRIIKSNRLFPIYFFKVIF